MKTRSGKILFFFCLFFPLSGVSLFSGSLPDYHDYNSFFTGTPAAISGAQYTFANPALLAMMPGPELTFCWSDIDGKSVNFNRWGLFIALPYFGWGVSHNTLGRFWVDDYRISLGAGNKSFSFGCGYGWSTGDKSAFDRTSILIVSSLFRPYRFLSLGLTGNHAPSTGGWQVIGDCAVRPFRNRNWTIFADYSFMDISKSAGSGWSMGTLIEPWAGLQASLRYSSSKILSCGVKMGFGTTHISVQPRFDLSRGHQDDIFTLSFGGTPDNVIKRINPKSKYPVLNLLGKIKYRKNSVFDRSRTLLSLLAVIDSAQKDDSVGGLILNISGMIMPGEMKWEISEKLQKFRQSGRKVIIYLDYADMSTYAFAAASADRIVIDPLGNISLMGLASSKSFFKGTLAKLGIGFDEWRYYKYKSANEMISRTNMSDADREQTKAYLESVYGVLSGKISESRNITPQKFEQLVNEFAWFSPEEALYNHLVDRIGHWENLPEILTNMEGKSKKMAGLEQISDPYLKYDEWGEPSRIAIVYALGICDMDTGITARNLVKDIQRVEKDPSIRAVVFRIDSPGGSALASDIVADAVRKCSLKKPVIVSQGSVAASGGYWLSMYGNTIVSSPITLTGSIGVIGGWIYNSGLKEKLGITTDKVKIGEHSDLGLGFQLLFLGGLPDRNLTEIEKTAMERHIRDMYTNFVGKVAGARHQSITNINKIAQGRIWSGLDAKEKGLVDVLGGLETALDIARQKAHILKGREIRIVELPVVQNAFLKQFMAAQGDSTFNSVKEVLDYLKFRISQNGQSLLLMPYDVDSDN